MDLNTNTQSFQYKKIDEYCSFEKATCCAFHPRFFIIAVGTQDGQVHFFFKKKINLFWTLDTTLPSPIRHIFFPLQSNDIIIVLANNAILKYEYYIHSPPLDVESTNINELIGGSAANLQSCCLATTPEKEVMFFSISQLATVASSSDAANSKICIMQFDHLRMKCLPFCDLNLPHKQNGRPVYISQLQFYSLNCCLAAATNTGDVFLLDLHSGHNLLHFSGAQNFRLSAMNVQFNANRVALLELLGDVDADDDADLCCQTNDIEVDIGDEEGIETAKEEQEGTEEITSSVHNLLVNNNKNPNAAYKKGKIEIRVTRRSPPSHRARRTHNEVILIVECQAGGSAKLLRYKLTVRRGHPRTLQYECVPDNITATIASKKTTAAAVSGSLQFKFPILQVIPSHLGTQTPALAIVLTRYQFYFVMLNDEPSNVNLSPQLHIGPSFINAHSFVDCAPVSCVAVHQLVQCAARSAHEMITDEEEEERGDASDACLLFTGHTDGSVRCWSKSRRTKFRLMLQKTISSKFCGDSNKNMNDNENANSKTNSDAIEKLIYHWNAHDHTAFLLSLCAHGICVHYNCRPSSSGIYRLEFSVDAAQSCSFMQLPLELSTPNNQPSSPPFFFLGKQFLCESISNSDVNIPLTTSSPPSSMDFHAGQKILALVFRNVWLAVINLTGDELIGCVNLHKEIGQTAPPDTIMPLKIVGSQVFQDTQRSVTVWLAVNDRIMCWRVRSNALIKCLDFKAKPTGSPSQTIDSLLILDCGDAKIGSKSVSRKKSTRKHHEIPYRSTSIDDIVLIDEAGGQEGKLSGDLVEANVRKTARRSVTPSSRFSFKISKGFWKHRSSTPTKISSAVSTDSNSNHQLLVVASSQVIQCFRLPFKFAAQSDPTSPALQLAASSSSHSSTIFATSQLSPKLLPVKEWSAAQLLQLTLLKSEECSSSSFASPPSADVQQVVAIQTTNHTEFHLPSSQQQSALIQLGDASNTRFALIASASQLLDDTPLNVKHNKRSHSHSHSHSIGCCDWRIARLPKANPFSAGRVCTTFHFCPRTANCVSFEHDATSMGENHLSARDPGHTRSIAFYALAKLEGAAASQQENDSTDTNNLMFPSPIEMFALPEFAVRSRERDQQDKMELRSVASHTQPQIQPNIDEKSKTGGKPGFFSRITRFSGSNKTPSVSASQPMKSSAHHSPPHSPPSHSPHHGGITLQEMHGRTTHTHLHTQQNSSSTSSDVSGIAARTKHVGRLPPTSALNSGTMATPRARPTTQPAPQQQQQRARATAAQPANSINNMLLEKLDQREEAVVQLAENAKQLKHGARDNFDNSKLIADKFALESDNTCRIS